MVGRWRSRLSKNVPPLQHFFAIPVLFLIASRFVDIDQLDRWPTWLEVGVKILIIVFLGGVLIMLGCFLFARNLQSCRACRAQKRSGLLRQVRTRKASLTVRIARSRHGHSVAPTRSSGAMMVRAQRPRDSALPFVLEARVMAKDLGG